ncbi:hypothetical protein QFC22_001106 [Naganishia vaughanmartiniae]|uniref:Uncharacterized protein n=1 Tax=Naganishia vaughanmartiniae TaxID=1424756 RepID=A0ACC2XLQ3_9TREE|nr:hypothetical protein QFC22_001106 [Naganishia vaughanmartiniae]
MARVPSAASLLNVVLGCYPTLRELELLEMSRTILGDDRSKEFVYCALRNCRLQVLGLKVAGGNRRAGVLDDVLEIIPEIRHLYLAADLISPEFFNNQLPKHLQEILLGCSTRKPVVFSGREAVEAFWKIGRTFANSNSAYMERTNTMDVRRYPAYSSDDNCNVTSSGGFAALHQRYRYDQDYPPLTFEYNYTQKLTDAIAKDRSSYELKVQPFDWENAFAYDVGATEGQISPVGLECWLVEEMRETGSLRGIAMPDSEISRVVQALCWRD